jgi:hypothetical protein
MFDFSDKSDSMIEFDTRFAFLTITRYYITNTAATTTATTATASVGTTTTATTTTWHMLFILLCHFHLVARR